MKGVKCMEMNAGIFKRVISVILMVVAGSHIAFAQTNTILDNFYAYLIDDKVYLNWVISSGSTCDGTKIYRATDSNNFTQIGDIQGICGSTSSPQAYDFYDSLPVKNSVNYYRLELGSLGNSEVVSVEYIAFDGDDYQIRPNPAGNNVRIFVDNPLRETRQLSLYSLNGKEYDVFTTKDDIFNLNVSHLASGLYIFVIHTNTNQLHISGKLSVVR